MQTCYPPMPDIHACTQLMLENAKLKRKVHKMKVENVSLQQQVEELREKQKIENLMREYVTTHNMETQTEHPKTGWTSHKQKKDASKEDATERMNKVLAMHNGLMRRYERELKTGMQHVEMITTLQLQVNELEQKLKADEVSKTSEKLSSRSKKQLQHGKKQDRGTLSQSSDEDDVIQVKRELKKVKKERDKLASENKKIQRELKGLDHGFFEEIEDLKYAFQEAVQLNQHYEKSLRRVCAKFGLPYPHPGNTTTPS